MSDFALTAKRGDTIKVRVTVQRDGAPVNLTGALFWLTAKRWMHQSDADALIQKSSAGGAVVVAAPATGVAIITINPDDTAGFTDSLQLHCDVQMVEQNGTVSTVALGTLTVLADVTRATA